MRKGVASLVVILLFFVVTSEANGPPGFAKRALNNVRRGIATCQGGVKHARENTAEKEKKSLKAAISDFAKIDELENLTYDEYQQMMDSVADELSTVFKPDAFVEVMDHLGNSFGHGHGYKRGVRRR